MLCFLCKSAYNGLRNTLKIFQVGGDIRNIRMSPNKYTQNISAKRREYKPKSRVQKLCISFLMSNVRSTNSSRNIIIKFNIRFIHIRV